MYIVKLCNSVLVKELFNTKQYCHVLVPNFKTMKIFCHTLMVAKATKVIIKLPLYNNIQCIWFNICIRKLW